METIQKMDGNWSVIIFFDQTNLREITLSDYHLGDIYSSLNRLNFYFRNKVKNN